MRSLTTMLRASTSLSSTPSITTTTNLLPKTTTTTTVTTPRRSFTTTPALPARAKPADKNAKGGAKGAAAKGKTPHKNDTSAAARRARRAAAAQKLDPKTANIMKFIYAGSQVRAPLRMARNRHMRHWTIHRAWLLFRRKRDEQREREMRRLRQSMEYACEALRNMEGPGTRPKGYLFRKAMEKTGLWGEQAIPIEYARPQVETPPEKPWNHEWKRPVWMK